MNQLNQKKYAIYAILAIVFLIILDQITKWMAINFLKDTAGIDIIEGVFKLHYLENKGAAFGIMQNRQLFFVFTGVFIIVVIGYMFMKLPFNKRFIPLKTCFVFLVSGAIGNMIDRLSYNFVVDFLYFELIDFPIFNVADIYVTVTMFVIVLLILCYYKDDEVEELFKCFRFRKSIPIE